MKITIVYVEGEKRLLQKLNIAEPVTIQQALELSDLKRKFPHIDITTSKIGVFGKISKLDAAVSDGDRIEIYRPITADPQAVKS